MQKFLPVGFSLPQTFSKPFHLCSLFDQSQFREANGVTSFQVSDVFASLSSLLNLLRKFPILKPVFRVPPFPQHWPQHSPGTVHGARQRWLELGFLHFSAPIRLCFLCFEGRLAAGSTVILPSSWSLHFNGKASSSQERVKPSEALGSFAGERVALLFVLKRWQESGEEKIT